jgi:hypothetical protein
MKEAVGNLRAEDLLPTSAFTPRPSRVDVGIHDNDDNDDTKSTKATKGKPKANKSSEPSYRVNPLAVLLRLDEFTLPTALSSSSSSSGSDSDDDDDDKSDTDDVDPKSVTNWVLNIGFGNESLDSSVRVPLRYSSRRYTIPFAMLN